MGSPPPSDYNDLVERLRLAGVVGLGGAGFPTHLKLRRHLHRVVVNAAECEPLLTADAHLLERFGQEVRRGALAVARTTGATEVILAVKAKRRHRAEGWAGAGGGGVTVRVAELPDVYPIGDELFTLRHAGGPPLPENALPVDHGWLVGNAGTFRAVAAALDGSPLIRRPVTVAGAVARPVTMDAALGTPFADLIAAAGGATCPAGALLEGGVMMGAAAQPDGVVTKTTAALVVLPADHPAILERSRSLAHSERLAEHTCCGCRRCTDLCSRYLFGHDLEPHRLMRRVQPGGGPGWPERDRLHHCSGCGLCALLACPFDLSPRRLILAARQGVPRPTPFRTSSEPRPEMNQALVTGDRLIAHLGLAPYDRPNHWLPDPPAPARLRLPLRQHVGRPAEPVVTVGSVVQAGQVLARVPAEWVGANLHTPMPGRVESVTVTDIVLVTDPAGRGGGLS